MPAKTCIFNQEIHSMAIISQDVIKLGCSGSQGKIQIQTLFVLRTSQGRACHPTCSTMVENPLQIGLFFCKTKPICRMLKTKTGIVGILHKYICIYLYTLHSPRLIYLIHPVILPENSCQFALTCPERSRMDSWLKLEFHRAAIPQLYTLHFNF